MTAAEARLRANNSNTKKASLNEIRIRTALNGFLNKVKETANEGGSQITYSVDGLRDWTEHAEVKNRLVKLGYTISKEKDTGVEWEVVSW
jgi:hypothetical protein